MGKIIVLDGTDGSGKATQTQLLYDYLLEHGFNVHKVSFPDYDSPTSSLVKMYLAGEFGKDAHDVNPIVASTFYAVDRVGSYLKSWKKIYEQEDSIILMDRYVTSNIIHQCSKIVSNEGKEQVANWIDDFEFNKLGLPRPDMVLFLDMEPEASEKLRKERNKDKVGFHDIHEQDPKHMQEAYDNAKYFSQLYDDWITIHCSFKGTALPIEDITYLIKDAVSGLLKI